MAGSCCSSSNSRSVMKNGFLFMMILIWLGASESFSHGYLPVNFKFNDPLSVIQSFVLGLLPVLTNYCYSHSHSQIKSVATISTGVGYGNPLYEQLKREAESVLEQEPALEFHLRNTVLAPGSASWEDAVANTICHRLLLNNKAQEDKDQDLHLAASITNLIRAAFDSDFLENGHSMREAVRLDIIAVVDRDPAMDTFLQVVLYAKGFAALVCHRVAHRLWLTENHKFTALFLQSQASAMFGVDLHPLAQIGARVLLDHGTGIVVGETATIGDGCTIMHGVTLGATGKDHGDRHPKIGSNVLIGAGSSILGNIRIGDSAKIGAGSVVLRSIPANATAVGAPAKIIGRTVESNPVADIGSGLIHFNPFIGSSSSTSLSTSPPASSNGDPCETQKKHQNLRHKQSHAYPLRPYHQYRQLAKYAGRKKQSRFFLGNDSQSKARTRAVSNGTASPSMETNGMPS